MKAALILIMVTQRAPNAQGAKCECNGTPVSPSVIPLTHALIARGEDVYGGATCIPDSAFEGGTVPLPLLLDAALPELTCIGSAAFSRLPARSSVKLRGPFPKLVFIDKYAFSAADQNGATLEFKGFGFDALTEVGSQAFYDLSAPTTVVELRGPFPRLEGLGQNSFRHVVRGTLLLDMFGCVGVRSAGGRARV